MGTFNDLCSNKLSQLFCCGVPHRRSSAVGSGAPVPLGAACRAKAQVPPIKNHRAAQRWHKYDTYYGNKHYYYHYYYYYILLLHIISEIPIWIHIWHIMALP